MSYGLLMHIKLGVLLCTCMLCVSDLFQEQSMAPGPLQQVTETMDECILLQACNGSLSLTQFHTLFPHFLHQHPFGLQRRDVLQLHYSWTISKSGIWTMQEIASLCISRHREVSYLQAALTQQPVNKLPVGLRDSRRGGIKQLGLA